MKRTFYVAGVQFRPRNEISQAVREISQELEVFKGVNLSLEPEPENKFDPNAVKILYNSEDVKDGGSFVPIFLGYIPKKYSSEVAGMLSIGAPVECIVDVVDPAAKTYEMFKVTVQLPVEEEESINEDLCGSEVDLPDVED